MNNSMILTNPTRQKVLWQVSTILSELQKDHRARKIKNIDSYKLDAIWQEPQGVIQVNGGTPSKLDGGYSAGQTSRLGIAWWTDRNDNKHVRVEADRTQASNFSVPDIFGSAAHPFHIVFPQHDPTYCVRCRHEIPPGEGHWDGDEKFTCDACVEQERYYLETGFLPPGSRRIKK